jgi:putative hydrolase of the HAD superfamily
MNINALFIDLDGTLYPLKNGLWDAISSKMNHYMETRLAIPPEEVPGLRQNYFRDYGTTLRGLQVHHEVDAEDYLAYVHDVPVSEYIKPDPALQEILQALPFPKWILTNSDRNHARRILAALGVEDQFEGIIDVLAAEYHPKPEPFVFEKALALAGDPNPESVIFLDDIPKNLVPAKEMGFITIMVGDREGVHGADFQIETIHDLPQVVAEVLK